MFYRMYKSTWSTGGSSNGDATHGRDLGWRSQSWCILADYEKWLKRNHEGFGPLPKVFTKTLISFKEPRSLYKFYQSKINTVPITNKEVHAWQTTAQQIELGAAKEAISAMRNLQAILQHKAQIFLGKSSKNNSWADQWEPVRIQNKEVRRILIKLEGLAQTLGRNNV